MDTRKDAITLDDVKGTKLTKFYKAVSEAVTTHTRSKDARVVRGIEGYQVQVSASYAPIFIKFYITDISDYEATLNIKTQRKDENHHHFWTINPHFLSHYVAADQIIIRLV